MLFWGLFALLFARPWLKAGHADWMAAGTASALGAGLFLWMDRPPAIKRLCLPLLFAGMGACFYLSGLEPGQAFPRALPGLELLISEGLGLATGACAVYLGLVEPGERALASGLLLVSAAVLFVCAGSMGVPEGSSWREGLMSRLAGEWNLLVVSGGLWRWGGLLVLYAASWVVYLSSGEVEAAPERGSRVAERLKWGR